MKKNQALVKAVTYVLLVACVTTMQGATAQATGLYFEDSDDNPDFAVPQGVAERSYRIPLIRFKTWGAFYLEPSKDSLVFNIQGSDYRVRYLGTVGDFYKVLYFDGRGYKILYTEIEASKRVTMIAKIPVRLAGTYLTTDILDAPNAGKQIRSQLYYYKAESGKTAVLTVSQDKAGKKIVETKKFTDGIVYKAEAGQYVQVKNAEIISIWTAPEKAITAYFNEHPEIMEGVKGFRMDPNEEYAWTDDAMLVNFF